MVMELNELLKLAVERKASDLHIVAGKEPSIRVNGDIIPIETDILTIENTLEYAKACLSKDKFEQFLMDGEIDFSMTVPQISRFRVNAFLQRNSVSIVFRVLSTNIPTLESLNLPPAIKEICQIKEGLILITGPTGSGKSTTMASIINEINSTRRGHILTLEDPIEYIFKHDKCIINQRQIGQDSKTYDSGLRAALREDPDVIFIGEMRDVDSISIAVTAAETGHLVLSTLHTLGAAKTVDRLIDVFPPYQQQQIRIQVSTALKAVISQKLLPDIAGTGRVAAHEIMMVTKAISNQIREGKSTGINSCIQTGANLGMQLLDRCIGNLYLEKRISMEVAVAYCTDKDSMKNYIESIR